jgi:eukaryotic-like serine/threonine-protein kinase
MELWVLSLRDRSPARVVGPARRGTFSPDGRWLAYESAVSGRNEVYLQPFPGPGERIQVSRSGAAQARWRDDGRELYYVGLDQRLMAVPVRLSADGRTADLGAETALFVTRLSTQELLFGGRRVEYLASPDGQRFLINAVPDEDAPAPIRMILNWRSPAR